GIRSRMTQIARSGRWGALVLLAIVTCFLVQVGFNPAIRCVQDEPWVSVPAYTLIMQGTLSLNPINADGKPAVWPPLLQLLLAGMYKVFGFGLVQGRSLMMLFGAVSIVFSYLLARELFDESTALISAAFLAVDNLFFLAARTIRSEILIVMLILIGYYFCVRGVRTRRPIFFIFSGLAAAAAMSTHPNGFAGLVAIMLVFPFVYGAPFLRQRGIYFFVAGVLVGSLPYVLYVLLVDLPNGFSAFSSQILTFAPAVRRSNWLLDSIRNEWQIRYQRFVLPPYRIHIGIILVAAIVASIVLPEKRRRCLAVGILVHLVLFVFLMTLQKNVRYMVLIAPYASIIIASLLMEIYRRGAGSRWAVLQHRTMTARVRASVLVLGMLLWGGTQFFGNIAYHVQYRKTDYNAFMSELQALIPEGAGIYSIITFWFGLYDHPFYSYNRVSFAAATSRYRPTIFLLDDTYMVNGEYGNHQWDDLRSRLYDFVDRNGTLVGIVDNWFYGAIKVYKVKY
ncbi:MAG TPA: glycosyltransferase family 39 protein, partial [Candidatus Paceibacterota bacterium]|nr:glycosyltransferase family 39 protein [Candidatus Paceibacterota bacterium]